VLLVERGGGVFGLPLPSVDEVTSVERIQSLAGRQSLELRGETVPFADLADVLGTPMPALPEQPPALIVSNGGRRLAVACDRLLGQEELVVKPLGALLEELPSYLGAAILGDSRIALLLDPAVLVRTEPRRSVAWQPSPDSQRPSPKLLVVEDSYMVRELQRGILEAAGYRIETAENGRDALLQLLADDDIELVLTDVEMPEMDGVELTRAIRATPTRTTLPVVILTSLVDEAQRQRGLEAGADAYMVKRSFDQGVLLDTVGRLVGA
jgi:two-component system, chemotaxis family, sensor kinase CheA